MRHITAPHMQAFVDELSKEAGLADYGKKALDFARGQLAGRYGRQLALGAGLGAVGGAVTGDDENWKGRALKGALLGGGLAGGRILATKAGREAAVGGAKRFGERQLYTLTGKGFKGRNIDVEAARELGIVPKALTEDVAKGLSAKELAKKTKDIAAHEKAFEKGFMNVPGVVHGALTQPGQLVRSGWERAGTGGKIFAGLGAAETAHGFAKKPEEGGPGRLESGMKGLGRTLGYLVAPGAMIGQSAIGGLGAAAGGTVGKIGDVTGQVVKARRAAQQAPEIPAYYGGRLSQGEWR